MFLTEPPPLCARGHPLRACQHGRPSTHRTFLVSIVLLVYIFSAQCPRGAAAIDPSECKIGVKNTDSIQAKTDLTEICQVSVTSIDGATAVVFKCRAAREAEATSLIRCQDHQQLGDFCLVVVKFGYLATHLRFWPERSTALCPGKIVQAMLSFDRPNIPFVADRFVYGENLALKRVSIHGADFPSNSLSRWAKAFVASDEIILQDVRALEPLNLGMTSARLLISRCKFSGMKPESLVVTRSTNVTLEDIDWSGQAVQSGAIILDYAGLCPSAPVEVTVKGVFNEAVMTDNPIVMMTKCDGGLDINVNLAGSGIWNRFPSRFFKSMLTMLLANDNGKLKLKYDPVDCCNVDNAWIFEVRKNAGAMKSPSQNIQIPCADLGALAFNYTKPEEVKELCDKRNVVPIYIIAIVSIIFITLVLLGCSCICVVYVLPKKKHPELLDGSETEAGGVPGSGLATTRSDHSGIKLLGSGATGGSAQSGSNTGMAKSSMGRASRASETGGNSRASSTSPSRKRSSRSRSASSSKKHGSQKGNRPRSGQSAVNGKRSGASVMSGNNASENSIKTIK